MDKITIQLLGKFIELEFNKEKKVDFGGKEFRILWSDIRLITFDLSAWDEPSLIPEEGMFFAIVEHCSEEIHWDAHYMNESCEYYISIGMKPQRDLPALEEKLIYLLNKED